MQTETKLADLEALASRVEALSRPDRAIDWEVHLRNGLDGVGAYGSHPTYTASIDAAMMLVPGVFSGQIWLRFNEGERNKPHAAIWSHDDGHGKPSRVNVEAKAATPALALCAASLRALAKGDV